VIEVHPFHPPMLPPEPVPAPTPPPSVNGEIQFSVATFQGAARYDVYCGAVRVSGDTLEGALLAFAERVNVVLR